ncbi:MAG: right-handed parallel beta-helix repeat-containing protein, partial [Anaerolineae bacterium]
TLAQQTIAQEMLALGATLAGDKWYYEGAPVEIILLIRTEDERTPIGDYVGDQLEDVGFTVIRDYKTSGEASSIWLNSDPAEGLFHIYTGGWITTQVPRDLSGNFAFFYTDMGLDVPLWQAYVNTPEFYELARKLNTKEFSTLTERRAMMAQALEWALEDSVRVWLHDKLSLTPRRAEVSYASDLYGGLAGSWLWPHTLERTGSFTTPLTIGSPGILLQPWNPLNGSNWVYDMMLIRATSDNGIIPDPYTGLAWPQRIERAEVVVQQDLPVFKTLDWVDLQFAPSIVVPDDAWVDWDATAQRFLTAAEVYAEPQTALRKTVVHYPADLYTAVTWHDGSPFSAADVVLNMILAFDRYKEASPVYDPTEVWQYDNFMATFKGVRILSTNPLVIEHYSNDYQLDAELGVATWWPFYQTGPGAWHNLALGLLAEQAGTGAFSQGKADANGVPQLDYVAWPGIAPLEGQLAAAQTANFIPYAPTLEAYITPAEAETRWTNLANWHAARNHFWIGTGPLYLEHALPSLGELSLKPYPAYPDAADRWAAFTEPAIAEVSIDGPDSIVLGDEAVFTVELTFDGQPYPHADVEAVRYLVLDSGDRTPFSGDATPVAGTDGLWRVTLTADMTRQLASGTNRLEIVVISKRVAVSSSATHTFTDAGPCYVRVSSLTGITYHDLQEAIDAAQPDDVLKVAGICTDVHDRPRRDLTTTGVVTQVAYIDKSLTLQGGYTTTNWLTPNPATNPTTLSAQGQGRAVYVTGAVNVTLDGFRITGGDPAGQGGSSWPDLDAGGGVYVITATVTLRKSQVFENVASGAGGGVYLHDSLSTLSNNTLTLNQAGWGGGVYLDTSAATLQKNTIAHNQVTESGGGVYLYESNATLANNKVTSNTAQTMGGGVDVLGGYPLVSGNVVRYNSAGYGGGVGVNRAGGQWANNVVADNHATSEGGGLYVFGGVPHLLHSTIARNSGGSGLYVTDNAPLGVPGIVTLTNTILVDHAIGISVTGGNALTADTLLWYNTPITVSYSPTAVVTILNDWTADPRFADDGYHLRIGSPAIDAGAPVALTRDVDGDPRPYGLGFDVGADEAPYVSVLPETGGTLVYSDTDGTETTVTVPPDAVSETTTVVLTQLEPETLETPPEFIAGGIALELDAYINDEQVENFSFNEPVTLTLEYTDEDVAGMDESTLRLHRYVCSGPETLLLCVWEEIGARSGEGQMLDMENNVLTAWLRGFSRFSGMGAGLEPAWELSKTYSSDRVAGMPVTYTVTIVNTGNADATTVVVEDVLPMHLTWISGGTLALNRVRWTFEAITAGDASGVGQFTAALPCVAGVEIVNDNYRVVSSAQGVTSASGPPVTFTVSAPAITVGAIQYTPLAPVAGETVYFTTTATTDGTPLSYVWSFGGTGPSAPYTFPAAGTYTVTVTATDMCEYARTVTATVDVLPAGYTVYLPLVLRE